MRKVGLGVFLLLLSPATFALGLDSAILESVHDSQFVHAQEKSASLASGDRWRRFLFKEPQFSYTNADSFNQESYGLTLTTPFPGKTIAYTELDRVKAKSEAAEIFAKKQE